MLISMNMMRLIVIHYRKQVPASHSPILTSFLLHTRGQHHHRHHPHHCIFLVVLLALLRCIVFTVRCVIPGALRRVRAFAVTNTFTYCTAYSWQS